MGPSLPVRPATQTDQSGRQSSGRCRRAAHTRTARHAEGTWRPSSHPRSRTPTAAPRPAARGLGAAAAAPRSAERRPARGPALAGTEDHHNQGQHRSQTRERRPQNPQLGPGLPIPLPSTHSFTRSPARSPAYCRASCAISSCWKTKLRVPSQSQITWASTAAAAKSSAAHAHRRPTTHCIPSRGLTRRSVGGSWSLKIRCPLPPSSPRALHGQFPRYRRGTALSDQSELLEHSGTRPSGCTISSRVARNAEGWSGTARRR